MPGTPSKKKNVIEALFTTKSWPSDNSNSRITYPLFVIKSPKPPLRSLFPTPPPSLLSCGFKQPPFTRTNEKERSLLVVGATVFVCSSLPTLFLLATFYSGTAPARCLPTVPPPGKAPALRVLSFREWQDRNETSSYFCRYRPPFLFLNLLKERRQRRRKPGVVYMCDVLATSVLSCPPLRLCYCLACHRCVLCLLK